MSNTDKNFHNASIYLLNELDDNTKKKTESSENTQNQQSGYDKTTRQTCTYHPLKELKSILKQ